MRRRVVAGRHHVARSGHNVAVRGQPFEPDYVTGRLYIRRHVATFCLRAERRPMTSIGRPSSPAAPTGAMLDRLSPAMTISQVATGGTLWLHRDFTPPPDRVAIERAFAELTWAGTGAPIPSAGRARAWQGPKNFSVPSTHPTSGNRWAARPAKATPLVNAIRSIETINLLRILAEDRRALGFSHSDLDG